MKKYRISISVLCGIIVFASFGILVKPQQAQAINKEIVFPVVGPVSFSSDFGAPRVGHTHRGNDIFAPKHTPLVAAVSGYVRWVAYPEPSYGWYLAIEAFDGWQYNYLHINNDTPGTDNGQGGAMFAYAPDMKSGNPVVAGQLVGWVGDSGNAEGTRPHLHFEIENPSGDAIDPFETLFYARHVSSPENYPPIDDEILPFGNFTGGASIALGEFHSRYEDKELVVGAGPGHNPIVRIIAQDRTVIGQFPVFEDSMRGGVDIAVGNTDGEGTDEIIVAAGEGSTPRVRIFNNRGVLQKEFEAFESWFRGGVRVAVADLDGDGIAEILTAPAKDYAPWLKVYDAQGRHQFEFLTYGIGFRGGFDVSASDETDVYPARIVTGAARGGGPHIRVFDPDGVRKSQFFSHGEGFRGGVRVEVANIYDNTSRPEIAVVPQSGGGPDFRIYDVNGKRVKFTTEYERWWRGGYDVAADEGEVWVVSQNSRRVSARPILQLSNWD